MRVANATDPRTHRGRAPRATARKSGVRRVSEAPDRTTQTVRPHLKMVGARSPIKTFAPLGLSLHQNYTGAETCGFFDLRRNEALCLRWDNVNLYLGTLCAMETKNRSDHVLPMGRYLWELMRQRRKATDSERVFANPLTGMRVTNPHRQVVSIIEKSGVQFSPHDLRRTFASIVSRLGDRLSYYTIKRLRNHRTSDVTQGYVQFDLEQWRMAMQAVEYFVLQHCVQDDRPREPTLGRQDE